MQAREIKALLDKRIKTFAISPTPIQSDIPSQHLPNRRHGRMLWCPNGLVRARIVLHGAKWIDKTTFGCTPTAKAHEVERTSGVLVEFAMPANFNEATAAKIDHVEVVEKAGNKYVQMVVSRKAIVMPWNDYKPVIEARRKEERESERRHERMQEAVIALGLTLDPEARNGNRASVRSNLEWDEERQAYVFRPERARVEMPLLYAEKLGKELATLREKVKS